MKAHIKTTQMRKLTLLLLLFTGMVNAQIVNIPDANFKSHLLSSSSTNGVAIDAFGSPIAIDINSDGEIQVSEALNVFRLHFYYQQISDLTGIQSFVNLKIFYSSGLSIDNYDISLFNSMNIEELRIINTTVNNLNVSGISSLKILDCTHSYLTSINISGLSNLEELICSENWLTTINLSTNNNLKKLYCRENYLTNINLTNLINLNTLDCTGCNLANLNLSTLSNLVDLTCSNNLLTNLNLTGLVNLEKLECKYNNLTNLDLLGLNNLNSLDCSYNELTSIDLTDMSSLISLNCEYNLLNTIETSDCINLQKLICGNNLLNTLDVTNLSNIILLYCNDNQLTNLNVSNLLNLIQLTCYNNQLENINISTNINLNSLICSNNLISVLDLSNSNNLLHLDCDNNNLTSLNLLNLVNLYTLNCGGNLFTSLDLSNQTKTNYLYCINNLLTEIDLSKMGINNDAINFYDLSESVNLNYINLKNNKPFNNLSTLSCANLSFVCADESNISQIEAQLISDNNLTTQVSSYCSFTPGGNYNTISGNVKYDTNNNGCDANDLAQPSIRVNINDGTNTGASFTSDTGNYSFFTQAGSFDLTPEIENPSFFNFTPTTATIPFTDNNNNTATQDFCFSANGVHPDLEVVLAPITPARPGFDAVYQLIYKNKGNQTLNGVLSLNYDVFRLLFISSNTIPDFNFEGTIDWNFTNLLPFESRSISLTLNVNSPLETPAVNIGDVLNFTATINPISGDELPDDNTFVYNQTVVGSYDPNDITCLEGNNVAPSEIGEYLHYVINFENTGNYPAENVVVKTIVDATKFDIDSLQLLNTSNPVDARITGNVVEFIFENIQLGGPGGHGHILLKIKSKNTLISGDTVAKNANIYFDYNAPVDTGMATTVFQSLSNAVFEKDDSINVSPNPTNGNININSNFNIKKLELYDVQGRILETQIGETKTLDISEKTNGIYFLKITTEKGSKVEKVAKE